MGHRALINKQGSSPRLSLGVLLYGDRQDMGVHSFWVSPPLYEPGLAEGNPETSELLYGQALKICSMIDLLGFEFLSFLKKDKVYF